MSKPYLILTPGAWHTSEIFDTFIPRLQSEGFAYSAIDFPSIGRDPPVKDLQSDIEVVREAVIKQSDAGHDIVLIVHSWSGLPVNSALEGLSKEERKAAGQPGGVVKIIFIAAFVLPVGISLFEALGGQVPPLWNIQGEQVYANGAAQAFYSDLDPETADSYASKLKPHARATKYAQATGAAWMTIPSVYIITEKDQAFPVFAQEATVMAMEEAGAPSHSRRIDSSHSPFVSQPEKMLTIIKEEAAHKSS